MNFNRNLFNDVQFDTILKKKKKRKKNNFFCFAKQTRQRKTEDFCLKNYLPNSSSISFEMLTDAKKLK
jgi:hypothetical protein